MVKIFSRVDWDRLDRLEKLFVCCTSEYQRSGRFAGRLRPELMPGNRGTAGLAQRQKTNTSFFTLLFVLAFGRSSYDCNTFETCSGMMTICTAFTGLHWVVDF